MKFVRTSYKIGETDLTVNNHYFTFNNFSDLLNQTEFDNWRLINSTYSLIEYDRIRNYRMPLSAVEWNKNTVFCNLDLCTIYHKMNITQRYYCEDPNFIVKYKIHFCDSLN